jgi:hypothetical protein
MTRGRWRLAPATGLSRVPPTRPRGPDLRRRAASVLGRTRAVVQVLLAALVFAGASPVHAQAEDPDPPLARRVKAAFIYKFLGYVDWPAHAFADSSSPLVIGVLGPDQVVAEVKEVIGERMVQGRAVVVRRMRDGDPLSGTHVLYVTRAETARTTALAGTARGTATLIVTEADGALALGSAINFRVVDGRVRFDIALATAERAGLRISSRLLAVAQNVRTTP